MASAPPWFLMSPPRFDWAPRGKANFKSEHSGLVAGGAALRDWRELLAAIETAGGKVVQMPTPDDAALTGLTFTAEAGQFAEDGTFLIGNLTPPHRQAEADIVDKFARQQGWRTRRVSAKWEGQGDVFDLGDGRTLHTWGEGPRARTSREAYREIREFFPRSLSLGFRADPWFHGNTFLGVFRSAAGPVMMLCEEALLPGEREKLGAFLEGVPVFRISREESLAYATNALQVNETVLAPRGLAPTTHAIWRGLGLRVVELGLETLFHAGGGAAVCLTNRVPFSVALRYALEA